MASLRQTIENLARNRQKWEAIIRAARCAQTRNNSGFGAELSEHLGFGTNPGNLRMLSFVPSRLKSDRGLVVVLHGCTQTAAGYNHGAGWSTLAERYGFVLLCPEQQRSNNGYGCFNWFEPGNIERDKGEALSIRQMVEKIVVDQRIDRQRVFITGLSAGAAMTSVMLACYPGVFAAGAIIGGLPYGAAKSLRQAFESMSGGVLRSAQEWGNLVRGVAFHKGPWPRISVWHGGADDTVVASNAGEIIKQWTNVHGLPASPSYESMADGYPRQVWLNGAGDELIESYTIPHMAHGTPLATGEADHECGAAGPFLLDVGISSSYHIAKFFGLTDGALRESASTRRAKDQSASARKHVERPTAALPETKVLEGEILTEDFEVPPKDGQVPPFPPIDVNAVITAALKAAGLMR